MCVKCGSLLDARKVFDHRKEQDNVSSWNTIIAAYRRHGFPHEAVTLFHQMQRTGIQSNHLTFASVLSTCAKMGALEQGMKIHQSIMEGGFLSDVVVASALLDMYAKCGRIDKAGDAFDRMPHRDVISWTAMITGYVQNGFVEKAFENFKQMQLVGTKPASSTIVSILPACAHIRALDLGTAIHKILIESGDSSDVVVATALVDMYAKCGSIDKAHELFDRMAQRNVISWNAMIGGYVPNGFVEKALETFTQMQLSGVKPNSTTFASTLPACAKMGTLEHGIDIHRSMKEEGFLSDIVISSALVDMYAKCGSIDKARKLFEKMPQRNVVSWTAMILGYAQNGFVEKALENFKQMQLAGVKPNSTTFASILPACAKMGALKQGIDIHQSITDEGFLSDATVATALLDMYAKCGSIDRVQELFDKMPQKTVVSWNSMITGYAQNGLYKDALKIFELMKYSRIYPDIVTFTHVLFACSHAGFVDEGCTYFNQMRNPYCMTPTVDHYVCMVVLLSRAGYLEDTLRLIIKMPVKPVLVVWMCFLAACRSHINIGLGVFTAVLLLEFDPKHAATNVLLSNIYAEVSRSGEVKMIRRLMKDKRN